MRTLYLVVAAGVLAGVVYVVYRNRHGELPAGGGVVLSPPTQRPEQVTVTSDREPTSEALPYNPRSYLPYS